MLARDLGPCTELLIMREQRLGQLAEFATSAGQ